MIGTMGKSWAANRTRFGLALRGGASALALSTVAIGGPAFAQASQDPAPAATDGSAVQANQSGGSGDAAAAPAQASDNNNILVTGIRRSLQRSQDIKRESDVIVDSVTAEDISALPDRSVTEALQRIPGVAINRFAAGVDPDHFSVEGSGVVVRGLTYVRSEINGRDSFTANNGRGLSFADVPSELLGGVDVFKSPSADLVEGGISGSVNLRTRLPLDQRNGLTFAGSVEGNYGDFAKRWSPTVSALISGRWVTSGGSEIGLLGSFVYSQIYSRADRIGISNYGQRTLFSNGNVVADNPLDPNDTPGTAVGTVYLPRGAVLGSQDFNRERYGYSAAAQWRSPDRSMIATFQFLRSDAREAWTEHTVEVATDVVTDQGDSFAPPGTTLEFDDNGIFQNGTIVAPTGYRDDQWGGDANGNVRSPRYGLQTQDIRRDVQQRFVTDDYSANFRWDISPRLRATFDYQHVNSRVTNLDTGIWAGNFQTASLGINGSHLPTVDFSIAPTCPQPGVCPPELQNPDSGSNPLYGTGTHTSLADPFNNFWRSAMDHIEDSTGNEDAGRIDLEMRFPDTPWLDSIKGGYRFADRENVARFSTYNWGVLSEIWGGGGPVWMDDPVDGVPGGTGGTNTVGATELYTFNNFMRGQAGDPLGGVGRLYYAANTAANYAAYSAFNLNVGDEWRPRLDPNTGCQQNWVPLAMRCGVTDATSPFLPQEINPVHETNNAVYLMARFANDFSNGTRLSGNIGLRYTDTVRRASGFQSFQQGIFSSEDDCNRTVDDDGNPVTPTPFCRLPLDVRNAARAFANGATTPSTVRLHYDYWLPSLNLKYEVGHGVQFRIGISRGIAPPDFGLTRNFYNLALATNQEDLDSNNGVPFATATVGNPLLRPTDATNFDFSAEWYFSNVGQLTLAVFYKRLHNVVSNGTERLSFTNNGATFDAIVTTPVNSDGTGKVRGFEIAYQQTYDFLPGPLRGLGLNASYTYVDSSGVAQSTLSATDPDVAAGKVANIDTTLLPLQGLSRHTINIQPFYEYGPLSLRLAYSWRSRFLLTTRDVIVPFAPIFNEATGQLDASIFLQITPHIRLGVQGVNLLNETLRTSQVIAASSSGIITAPRSWYMNDRRYSFILRATF